MDFNTGGGRSEDEQSRPLYGEEAGGRARGPAPGPVGSPGREFTISKTQLTALSAPPGACCSTQ
jgi:hypothetical protein